MGEFEKLWEKGTVPGLLTRAAGGREHGLRAVGGVFQGLPHAPLGSPGLPWPPPGYALDTPGPTQDSPRPPSPARPCPPWAALARLGVTLARPGPTLRRPWPALGRFWGYPRPTPMRRAAVLRLGLSLSVRLS